MKCYIQLLKFIINNYLIILTRLSFLNPILNRKKYEGNHWDDVIYKYKEFELTNRKYKILDNIKTCLEKVQHIIDNNQNDNNSNNNNRIDFLDSPHIIDLHKDGYIGNLNFLYYSYSNHYNRSSY